MRNCTPVAVLLLTLALGGCSAGYYFQAVTGHFGVMRARQPLERVLSDPQTPPDLRDSLRLADEVLVFARTRLGMPRPVGYRHYADLGREYVVWNVFSAPEFSLEPQEWCYPVAGCAFYRGWFDEASARRYAADLARRGNDVFVAGVTAYSTLGWFADPVLNTMVRRGYVELVGILLHELAHQLVHVPGDTLFIEGFASFVQQEGSLRWLVFRRDRDGICQLQTALERRTAAWALLDELRTGLQAVYTSAGGPGDMRRARAARIEATRADYADLRRTWSSPPHFDSWFGENLNNATLTAHASYETYVPAFRALLAAEAGDLARFYDRVRVIARLPEAERQAILEALIPTGRALRNGPAGLACPPTR